MQKMVRHGNKTAASDLVNFHFSSSPPTQSHMTSPPRRNPSVQNRQQSRRSLQDRSSARRKAASSMFHLHSSADHAFCIARGSKQGHSFCGPDEAVSWAAVRTVKCLVPFEEDGAQTTEVRQETCPVCLDTFTCPRITKCGHCFCLPCLLRHFHTRAEYKTQAVMCPCCGLPVYVQDCRLVVFKSVQSPRIQGKMTMVKLHRQKYCPAPYLPRHGAFRHSSPHMAPMASDRDAVFCRFNYVDPDLYQSQLTENQVELESVISELQQQKTRHESVEMERIFLQMALESIHMEQLKATEESEEEQSRAEQYRQPHAGMYQAFPERVFTKKTHPAKPVGEKTVDTNAVATRPSRSESMDSTGSQHAARTRKEGRIYTPVATMYLDQDTTHFYQSVDGQLCFLSRFNMRCLAADFTASIPEHLIEEELSQSHLRRLLPFPDVIEGNILDKESVQLTPDVRKRLPFLSHLPLYADIVFVELDLNRILSEQTKQKFHSEMEKRRKMRKNKVAAEKRADRIAKEKEEARINELKSRFHQIDPSDEFFLVSQEPPELSLTGEDFGPATSANTAPDVASDPQVSSLRVTPQSPPLSFRAAIVSGLNPTTVTEDAFPSLSSSPPMESRNVSSNWSGMPSWHGGTRTKSIEEGSLDASSSSPPHSTAPVRKGKKSKAKKVLLLSTGGHRGGA